MSLQSSRAYHVANLRRATSPGEENGAASSQKAAGKLVLGRSGLANLDGACSGDAGKSSSDESGLHFGGGVGYLRTGKQTREVALELEARGGVGSWLWRLADSFREDTVCLLCSPNLISTEADGTSPRLARSEVSMAEAQTGWLARCPPALGVAWPHGRVVRSVFRLTWLLDAAGPP